VSTSNRLIARLLMTSMLAGASAVMAAPAYAAAETAAPSSSDDEPGQVLFEADSVRRDFDDGPIIAEGDVRAYFGERYPKSLARAILFVRYPKSLARAIRGISAVA
jgi:lipopolysaccharide assembly outer membrane protein LptD (OstA)